MKAPLSSAFHVHWSLLLLFLILPSTPAATLIPQGAVWKYLDDGSDAGIAWRELNYSDAHWPQGPAQLGYGDNDEMTIVNSGLPGPRHLTTYFRHVMEVNDPALYTRLVLRVLRDDGVVVYLNGVEVFRDNLPLSIPITYQTPATQNAIDENAFLTSSIPASLLVVGLNVVTVEIHNSSPASGDISFDLSLTADGGPAVPERPIVTVRAQEPEVTEPLPSQFLPPGIFIVEADRQLDQPVRVQFTLLGTATAGADYVNVTNEVTLPAGTNRALVVISPLHDAEFEDPETVEFYLRPAFCLDPSAGGCYLVGQRTRAEIVILDAPFTNHPPAVELLSPSDGEAFAPGSILLEAHVVDVDGNLSSVEFFDGAQSLGPGIPRSGPAPNNKWFLEVPVTALGEHFLTARATDSRGATGQSPPVRVRIATDNCRPGLQWQVAYGGAYYERPYRIHPMADGGYILGGETDSSGGNWNIWVMRLNSAGGLVWQKQFGGENAEYLADFQITADGGSVAVGSSDSMTGPNKSASNHGMHDFWVLRLDAAGNRLWDASFGGNQNDFGRSVRQTPDGGFIVAGDSFSGVSGNKTSPNYGNYDWCLVRLDPNGSVLWNRSYGGTNEELYGSVILTASGGYLLHGVTGSGATGNKTSPHYGELDAWILRLTSDGLPIWDKTFGGTGNEWLGSALQASNATFVLAGYSTSPPSTNKLSPHFGDADAWMLWLDEAGGRSREQTFGGTSGDGFIGLSPTSDGGYVAGGFSQSGVNGNKTSTKISLSDYWLVRLDPSGNRRWELTVGGATNSGSALNALAQTADGGFVLAGDTSSGVGGSKTNDAGGLLDAWIVRLDPELLNCDADRDGIADYRDDCPASAPGEEVDARGCSVAQHCDCQRPWTSHAAYVNCTIQQAWRSFRAGHLTEQQRRQAIRNAVLSDCARALAGDPLTLHILPQTIPERLSAGFQVIISGNTNVSGILECSEDLNQWTAIQTNAVAVTGLEITLPFSTGHPGRFYRVVP